MDRPSMDVLARMPLAVGHVPNRDRAIPGGRDKQSSRGRKLEREERGRVPSQAASPLSGFSIEDLNGEAGALVVRSVPPQAAAGQQLSVRRKGHGGCLLGVRRRGNPQARNRSGRQGAVVFTRRHVVRPRQPSCPVRQQEM